MEKIAIKDCEILIPNEKTDRTLFSCIACDQFTSEVEYWQKLDKLTSGHKRALDLIFPEVYLGKDDDARIKSINENIKQYLKDGVFLRLNKGFILTVRKTPYVEKRIGLIGALDLEEYDYKKDSKTLVRATEGVIEERIPPRVKIRENALMEFPHIMVLYDDEKKEIAEYLYKNRNNYEKIYDFPLNMGGGSVEGYFIPDKDLVLSKFSELLNEDRLKQKYVAVDKFLFAVGDGNHSLATAKRHWERVKATLSEKERETHPARYALAEFNNIYDEGIYFEPIYRFIKLKSENDAKTLTKRLTDFVCGIKIIVGNKVVGKTDNDNIPQKIKTTDEIVKEFIEKNGGSIDYVHGEDNLKELVNNNAYSIGVMFEKIEKSLLFSYVSKNGPFPKKTFSMGEGIEKRYYFEGRIIKEEL